MLLIEQWCSILLPVTSAREWITSSLYINSSLDLTSNGRQQCCITRFVAYSNTTQLVVLLTVIRNTLTTLNHPFSFPMDFLIVDVAYMAL